MKRLITGLLAAVGMKPPAPDRADTVDTAPAAGANQDVLRAAHTIMRLPASRDSWTDYIQHGHDEDFIWTNNGDGDMVEQWNRLYGAGVGLADIAWELEGDRAEFYIYRYKDRRLQFVDPQGSDCDMMVMLTMNRLLQPDSEIRVCVDSLHNSDLAWLALPSAAWQALAQHYGADAVAYRFMVLPDDLAGFDIAYMRNSREASDRFYNQR